MTWNYRIMRRKYPHQDEYYFEIHEVYYTKSGKVWSWSEEPCGPAGDTIGDLRSDIKLFRAALDKPILDYEMKPEAKGPK